MEMGALETLMLFEDLEVNRYVLKHPLTGGTKVVMLNPMQEKSQKFMRDQGKQVDYDVIESCPLAEWLCNNYAKFGVTLEFITDKSQEGYQFVKGFGGIGGFLRYKIDVSNHMNGEISGGDNFDADLDFI